MSFPAHSSHHVSILLSQSEGYMSWIASRSDPKFQQKLTLLTCGLVGLIGLADFWLGTNLSLEVFYFIPVALAVFARGRTFGLGVSVASVVIWAAGGLRASMEPSHEPSGTPFRRPHLTTPLAPMIRSRRKVRSPMRASVRSRATWRSGTKSTSSQVR